MTKTIEVSTQAEFDVAAKKKDNVKIISGFIVLAFSALSPLIEVTASAHLKIEVAQDTSRVEAQDTSRVEAWGSSSVEARDTSSVEARDTSRVEARDTSRVVAWGSSSVVARDTSSVVARDTSRVVAWDTSSVEARDTSRVVARGSSSVVARDTSRVEAWDTSSVVAQDTSRVVARDTSRVEAWDTSSVEARDTSSVEARGDVFIRAYGCKSIKASLNVVIKIHEKPKELSGGTTISPSDFSTPKLWCSHFGVEVQDGKALLFKGLNENFKSERGGDYAPETIPVCGDWDGGKIECGKGYHVSPHPKMTLEFCIPKKFVAGWVNFSDMAVHPNGKYPQKCKIHKYALPVWECDENGVPVKEAEQP